MQQNEHIISVDESGSLQFVYSDDLYFLLKLGETTTTRASNVEPAGNDQWTATMTDGTALGPFDLRKDALSAEVEFLKERL